MKFFQNIIWTQLYKPAQIWNLPKSPFLTPLQRWSTELELSPDSLYKKIHFQLMERKTPNRTRRKQRSNQKSKKRMNKGSLSRHFTVGIAKPPLPNQQQLHSSLSNVTLPNPSRFQKLLDSDDLPPAQSQFSSVLPLNLDADDDADVADVAEKDFILSQDFFW